MRMYVMLALAVVFVTVLLILLDRALKAVRTGRRRREAAIRLAPAAAQAEAEVRKRAAAARAQDALTTVLPGILEEEREPRRVE